MYQITAEVFNCFSVPASKDYEESFKVQIMGETSMKDGQIKKEMLTLNVPEKVFMSVKDSVGEIVTLPVAFYAKNNQVNVFYPKN